MAGRVRHNDLMDDESPEAAYRLLHERVTGGSPEAGGSSISAAQYDAARSAYLEERGIVARVGVAVWPPTSQTIRQRLGGGSWARAAEALGLTANAGRSRGAGSFSDDDYRAAVAAFLAAAADDGRPDVASASFTAYGAWVKSESDAGRTAPSGAAMRQHFGSWAAAKGAVARG